MGMTDAQAIVRALREVRGVLSRIAFYAAKRVDYEDVDYIDVKLDDWLDGTDGSAGGDGVPLRGGAGDSASVGGGGGT